MRSRGALTIPCNWCFDHGGELEVNSTVESSHTCEHSLVCSWCMHTRSCHIASVHQRNISTTKTNLIFQIYGIGCTTTARRRRCVLYMASFSYIIIAQRTTSSKRMCGVQAAVLLREWTSKHLKYFFFGYTNVAKSIYIMTNFHASEELRWGSEFSGNYTINYLINILHHDYLITARKRIATGNVIMYTYIYFINDLITEIHRYWVILSPFFHILVLFFSACSIIGITFNDTPAARKVAIIVNVVTINSTKTCT